MGNFDFRLLAQVLGGLQQGRRSGYAGAQASDLTAQKQAELTAYQRVMAKAATSRAETGATRASDQDAAAALRNFRQTQNDLAGTDLDTQRRILAPMRDAIYSRHGIRLSVAGDPAAPGAPVPAQPPGGFGLGGDGSVPSPAGGFGGFGLPPDGLPAGGPVVGVASPVGAPPGVIPALPLLPRQAIQQTHYGNMDRNGAVNAQANSDRVHGFKDAEGDTIPGTLETAAGGLKDRQKGTAANALGKLAPLLPYLQANPALREPVFSAVGGIMGAALPNAPFTSIAPDPTKPLALPKSVSSQNLYRDRTGRAAIIGARNGTTRTNLYGQQVTNTAQHNKAMEGIAGQNAATAAKNAATSRMNAMTTAQRLQAEQRKAQATGKALNVPALIKGEQSVIDFNQRQKDAVLTKKSTGGAYIPLTDSDKAVIAAADANILKAQHNVRAYQRGANPVTGQALGGAARPSAPAAHVGAPPAVHHSLVQPRHPATGQFVRPVAPKSRPAKAGGGRADYSRMTTSQLLHRLADKVK